MPKGHIGLHSLSTPSTSRRIDQMVPRYMEILQRNALTTKKVSWTSTLVTSQKVDFFINTGEFKDTSRLVLGNLHVCCVYSSTSWEIDGSIKKFSSKEAIDHYNVKYKVGETHCMYLRQHRTRIWNDNRNYVNRALNCTTKNNDFDNNFHTRIRHRNNY